MSAYSSTVRAMIEYLEPVITFLGDAELSARASRPEASDFQVGNPHEMPLPEIQQALTRSAAPQDQDWFAYKFSEPKAVAVAVESLRRHVGIEFDPADVSMTTGAFGGLASTLRAVLDPGDEVIYLSPPWARRRCASITRRPDSSFQSRRSSARSRSGHVPSS
ncbi:MAG: hypothetical protein E6J28_14260 [Chloroflexi bacterium]|nr:MAG: hypothetical protein E6J28_14260 [Chloroflexota bacterium]